MDAIHIAACSYEGSLFGWTVSDIKSVEDDFLEAKEVTEVTEEGEDAPHSKANLDFAFHASSGSLKAIAVSKSGKYLAVGGMNERIHVFSLGSYTSSGSKPGTNMIVQCSW